MSVFDYREVHISSNEQLEDYYKKILETIHKTDPIELITNITIYYYISLNKEIQLDPGHLEYICNLIACESSKVKENPGNINLADLQQLMSNLKEFFDSWVISNFARKVKDIVDDDVEFRKQSILASLAVDYASIGGEFNYDLVVSQLNRLFFPFDEWMKQFYGFSIEQALQIIEAINHLYEERLIKFKQDIIEKAKFNSSSVYSNILNKCRNGQVNEEELKFKSMFENDYENILRHFTLEEYDKAEKDILFLSLDDINILDKNVAEAYFQRYSMNIRSDVNQSFKYPTEENNFRNRPIIQIDKKYLIPNIMNLLWALNSETENDIFTIDKLKDSYIEKKGDYLEEEANTLFKKALPHCQIFPSVYYFNENNERCELDSLIIYDSNILLVESKSGRFSKPARRGAVLRLAKNIEENIEVAFNQAKRARDFIYRYETPVFTDKNGNPIVQLNKEDFFNIYLINCTLDSYSEIATNLNEVGEIQLYKQTEYPWSVNLQDLKKIVHFIEYPSQLLHYIHRRLRINNRMERTGFVKSFYELDLFCNYLEENLYFDSPEGSPYILLDNQGANRLNQIYINPELKNSLLKRVINTEFNELIASIESLNQFGHTYFIIKLLDLSSRARAELIDLLKQATSIAKDRNRLVECLMPLEENRQEDKKIGIHIISVSEKELDLDLLYSRALLRKYYFKATEWIVLIKSTDDPFMTNVKYFIGLIKEETYDEELERLCNIYKIE